MRVLVSLAEHFVKVGTRIYAPVYGYERFWSRYLEVFDEVVVLGRTRTDDSVPNSAVEASGPGVRFCPLPDHRGPWQYMRCRHELKKLVSHAVDQADAFILRVPCHIGTVVEKELAQRGWPFAVEVVADPWVALAPGNVKSVVRPIARRRGAANLRRQCSEAMAAAYVTQKALQQRYPAATPDRSYGCSDVVLPDRDIVDDLTSRHQRINSMPDRLDSQGPPVRLGYVGTFEVMYKAPDVHLQAVSLCRKRGLNVELILAGEGRHRSEMEALASRLGVSPHVHFTGQLPSGQAVLSLLDDIDLFLIASKTEGLPRALVEAMARGCPAIGSDVGGIPELLPPDCLVRPGDPEDLANLIEKLLRDPAYCVELAEQNRDKAREYSQCLLDERRRAFYEFVRDRTAGFSNERTEPQKLSL